MEKIETKEVTVVQTIHRFYCDKCGDHFGSSVEHEDGWFEDLGYVSYYFKFNEHLYTFRGHFCNDCFNGFVENVGKNLKSLGFKEE